MKINFVVDLGNTDKMFLSEKLEELKKIELLVKEEIQKQENEEKERTKETEKTKNDSLRIKEILESLSKKYGSFPIDKVFIIGVEEGISKNLIEEWIERLKREGYLFEPSKGNIQLI